MALVPPTSGKAGYPLGLTGATAATRYVGATASGAPASGTFAVGDFVITQNGRVFICTTAGSPGTWTQAGGASGPFPPGYEYAYAQITAPVSITATTEAGADTVITAGAVVLDGSTVVKIEAFTPIFISPGGGVSRQCTCVLFGAKDGAAAAAIGQVGQIFATLADSIQSPGTMSYRLTPASGSWVYSLRALVNAGTGTVYAGAAGAGAAVPAYLRVVQV